eukprot:m.68405 g.68405  ORF g.68405 m.68405 type:complete len:672 (-) comp12194_c0_seq5:54-2069(-)
MSHLSKIARCLSWHTPRAHRCFACAASQHASRHAVPLIMRSSPARQGATVREPCMARLASTTVGGKATMKSPKVKSSMRTHMCGDVDVTQLGEEATVCGWVKSIRRAQSGLYFVDIKDITGVVQVKVDGSEDLIATAEQLKTEDVVQVTGTVASVPGKDKQRIELATSALNVLNKTLARPFDASNSVPAEMLRLEHRPFDLRRETMQRNILARAKAATAARSVLNEQGFHDIETPTLFKRTPGGASEFLVPTKHRGQFYALVQSPQQYKQMLMVAGFDRYYQFARCYRDEGGRMDRQPEFTQIDIEMSFIEQQDIKDITERIVRAVWQNAINVTLPETFPTMTFADAMHNYGVDKPDTRYEMTLKYADETLSTAIIANVPFWTQVNGAVIGFSAPSTADLFSRKVSDKIVEHGKGIDGPTLVVCRVGADGTLQSSISKWLSDDVQAALIQAMNAKQGDTFFITADTKKNAQAFMGKMRGHVASVLAENNMLFDTPQQEKAFNFLWVVDFPMFEPHELTEGRWQACHHPFTAPHPDDDHLLQTDPTQARAQHFDLVLNGVEIAGGSVRVHDPETQRYILQDILHEDITVFEQVLRSLSSGAPPHGGIAFGFDRLIMLMLSNHEESPASLRDVIAFPKSFSGKEVMSGAPGAVSPQDLAEYHIQVMDDKGNKA